MNRAEEIKFLVGDKNFKKRLLKPYDEEICKFLSTLSLELNKIKNLNPLASLKNLLNISKIESNDIDIPYPILVGYLGYPMIQHMEKIELKICENYRSFRSIRTPLLFG